MKNLYKILTVFALLLPCFLQAQFYEDLPVSVTIDGELKINGFAGGHNIPQFSEADFNNDGLMDLYVFDKEGGVSMTYLQVIENGSPRFEYAPLYRRNFPQLSNWVLVRDYNGDGAHDIFASAADEGVAGIKVFRGFYEDNRLNFERVDFYEDFTFNILTFPLANGLATNVLVSNIDYPVVDDIDNDSDLDVLSFDSGGSHVVWYRNMSVENGFGVDSLIFRLEDDCWGSFKEAGLSPEITLSDIPGECVSGLPMTTHDAIVQDRHAGSTLLTFDENNDIDKEIFIGDLISPSLVGLTNAGVLDEAWMNEQDVTYPSYDVPVEINFPAAFYVDVDFDGAKDLIAAPNETNNSPNYDVAWFYKNTNTTESPVFEFQQRDFIVETMLDLGENAYPTIADVTGDGLLDLVVGNVGYFQSNGDLEASLFLFENVGTATEPAFELIDDDWLNFNQYSSVTNAFQPTFGDLDSDGDLDLLVGENTGYLFYAENTAGAGNPMTFSAVVPQWQSINVGQRSSPTIVDLNDDGKPDLLVGERNRFLNFLPNQGTATNPVFSPDPSDAVNNPFFGKITATEAEGAVTAFATPILIPYGNKFRLFIGNEPGNIWLYDNLGVGMPDSLIRTSNFLGMIDEGREASIAAADLNDDGLLDFVIGNRRGGVRILGTDLLVEPPNSTTETNEIVFDLFPNPASDKIFLNLSHLTENAVTCTLFNALGMVLETRMISPNDAVMNVDNLPTGVYFCEIKAGKKRGVQRFVKQ